MKVATMIVSCAILTATGAVLTGCGDNVTAEKLEKAAENAEAATLYNITWIPQSITTQADTVVPAGVFIAFDPVAKRLYGNSGVNRFSATYALPEGEHKDGKKNKIKVDPIASTMMAGPDEAMKYETIFLQNLNSIDGYSVLDGELNLYAGENLIGSFSNGGAVSTEKTQPAPKAPAEAQPAAK